MSCTVCFVLEHFHPYIGGVEKLFWSLSRVLVQQGYTVKVITTRFDKKLPCNETIDGVEIIRLPIKNRFLFTFWGVFGVYKHTKSANIIHTTSYNAAVPAFIAAKLRGTPAIITFHEVWAKLWWKLPFLSFPQRLLFWTFEQLVVRLPFQKFIAVSDYTHISLLEYHLPERVIRIYNGLEYPSNPIPRNLSESEFNFLFFGRLGVSKGLDLLLDASEQFYARHSNVRLTLIIPTVPRAFYNKIMRIIKLKKLEGKIRILHSLPQATLNSELAAAHCVVVPSYTEGFGFALAETIALGIPVITSAKAAIPEVVSGKHIIMHEHSWNGLLAALERAYLNDWDFLPEKRFDLHDKVSQYVTLYASLSKK